MFDVYFFGLFLEVYNITNIIFCARTDFGPMQAQGRRFFLFTMFFPFVDNDIYYRKHQGLFEQT